MKGRRTRSTGGTDDAGEDLSRKNKRYTYQSNVNDEAEERKRGGRAKRKSGGMVAGCAPSPNAGRAPRKSGGRATSDNNPFTSARKGTPAPGRKVEMMD